MKRLLTVLRNSHPHWVGDGFPVRTLFSPRHYAEWTSPFLMLDYAGPAEFPPTTQPRGVDVHPHRGFETVTIVYAGEIEHRDSGGGGGRIGPGDVQWMTAASGVVHEERHGREFAERGGTLEMVQLWVNLPARDKLNPPRYQSLMAASIPAVLLPTGKGTARVIAGGFESTQGPAQTFTPMNVWDLQIQPGPVRFSLPTGHTALILVLEGALRIDGQTVNAAELAVLDRETTDVAFEAIDRTRCLVLSGEPIREPVVAHGPFVMNTEAEIQQAFEDYHAGRMGQLVR